jgi:MFS transporter, PHS family, inorganic phosphate transporter
MGWMFVALAAIFAINGATFFVTFETDKHALTLTLYVLAQVLFNLGPNTMTFILPAELFGTKYRATFYGLAAASGKLGAIIIQLVLNLALYRDDISNTQEYKRNFAGLLLGFVPAMLLGALVTWVWIPEVQFPRGYGHNSADEPDENASFDGRDAAASNESFRKLLRLPNRPLEQIDRQPGEGQELGMRRNLAKLFHVRRRKNGNTEPQQLMSVIEGGQMEQELMFHQHHTSGIESDLGDGFEA